MPVSVDGVQSRIQKLVDDRAAHQKAIESIDATLEQISRALGSLGAGVIAGPRRMGRPPGSGSKASLPAVAKPKGKGGGRGKRGRFAQSGDEFVLSVVERQPNINTKALNSAWTSAGRGGTADNSLTKLVKEKKLKRTPIEGQRGSTYAIA